MIDEGDTFFCSVTLNGKTHKTEAVENLEWDKELRFTLFEDPDDEFGRPADGGGPPSPLPPKSPKDPPSIVGGKFMNIVVSFPSTRSSTDIGETVVDLTKVLITGEINGAFIQVPVFPSLINPQNGFRSPLRTSTAGKYF